MIITDAEIQACRDLAEQAMTCRLYITGPSTKGFDPATGQNTTIPGPARYGTLADPGVGLVQAAAQQEAAEQVIGGQVVTRSAYAVKVPVSVGNVLVDDEVHVVSADDPTLSGVTLIVAEAKAANELAIQRRLICTLTMG